MSDQGDKPVLPTPEITSGEDHDMVDYYVDEQGNLQGNRRKADKVLLRLKTVEEKQEQFGNQLERNTALTQKVSYDTNEILELLAGVRGVIRLSLLISNFLKWLLGTALAVYGLYLLWKGRVPDDLVNPFK